MIFNPIPPPVPNKEQIVNATNTAGWSGSDLGAWVNAAFTAGGNTCVVRVAAGSYTQVTTIIYPVTAAGNAVLIFDEGAAVAYTGSSYGIDAATPDGLSNAANVLIKGYHCVGTSSGLAGIHLKAFNKGGIYDVDVSSFTNGAGILNEGANTVSYYNCNTRANKDGLRNVGVVAFTLNFQANACVWFGGHIQNNVRYGVFEDASLSGTVGLNTSNNYIGAVIEGNGTGSAANSGNVFVQGGSCINFTDCYFEVGAAISTHLVTVGDGTFTGYNIGFDSCSFASGTTTTESINLVRATHTAVQNCKEITTTAIFVNSTSNVSQSLCGGNVTAGATLYGGTINSDCNFVDVTNRVGLGIVPRCTLEIAANGFDPQALNTAVTRGFGISDGGTTILNAGFSDTGTLRSWLQARDIAGNSAARAITLNELGGNVGIGTSTPGATLDVSGTIRASGGTFTGPLTPAEYTVAALPAGVEGMVAYATNGRKVGEGAGAGTGVPVYFSHTSWRVFSGDGAVAA